MRLLADAEILEDIVECVLTGDTAAKDAVEGGDNGAEVFCDEITAEVGVEAGDYLL